MEIFDITVPISKNTLAFPGDKRVEIISDADFSKGDAYRLHNIGFSLHFGTHIDFPGHVFEKGKLIDEYPIDRFVSSAYVIDLTGRLQIAKTDLMDIDFRKGDSLLFKTDNSLNRLLYCDFHEDFCHITIDAAEYIVKLKPNLVGIDYLSPEPIENLNLPVHRLFLGNGILLLESIDLKMVEPGKYKLHCYPLKLSGVEASPVRAVLIR